MFTRRWNTLLATFGAAFALFLGGCGGGGGSPAAAPTLQLVQAGDGQVVMSWQSTSGVYYWLWYILNAATTVTIGTGGNAQGGQVNVMSVNSPYVMSGIANGFPSSYAINAHAGNPTGPGGAASNTVSAIPRLAGSSWVTCTTACPASSTTLYGVAFGENGTGAVDGSIIHYYLAVGSGGAMYASKDSKAWTALASQAACTPSGGGALRVADYGWGVFVAAGDNGTICFSGYNSANSAAVPLVIATSPTLATWNAALTNPVAGNASVSFRGLATNQVAWNAGSGNHVLVGSNGSNGLILESTDGQNWTQATLPSVSPLNAIGYNATYYNVNNTSYFSSYSLSSCGLPNYYWIAVGNAGTILGTTDSSGLTGWTAVVNGGKSYNLTGVACTLNSTPSSTPGVAPSTYVPLWVAVGSGGTVLTSTDGINWNAPSALSGVPTGTNFTNLMFGTQFVATTDTGAVYTSVNGTNWTLQSSGASQPLYGLTAPLGTAVSNGSYGSIAFGYTAVGAGGITTFAQ